MCTVCRYDDVVTFLDPITKYNNVQGYMFNIRMLKTSERAAVLLCTLFDLRQSLASGRGVVMPLVV